MTKGLLIRVGIDSTDGRWNAPVDSRTGEFAYITITETKPLRAGLARLYDEFQPALSRFGLNLPAHLVGLNTHLDPDFLALTYGDQGSRAKQLGRLEEDDLLVFFTGMRDVSNPTGELVYAIIGLYVISEIVAANDIEESRWLENAHTRRIPGATDVVVRAKSGVSGRLERCIPIGEYRDRAYRVKRPLLRAWGGLSVRDGYLQRSARLPALRNASKFYQWFLSERPRFVRTNKT